MHIEHVASSLDSTFFDELDHASHTLTFVDRIGNEGVCSGRHLHGVDCGRPRYTIDAFVETIVQHDGFIGDNQTRIQKLCGIATVTFKYVMTTVTVAPNRTISFSLARCRSAMAEVNCE